MARRLGALLLVLALGCVALAPVSTSAQALCPGLARPVFAYAYEQLTVADTAVPLTVATYLTGNFSPAVAVARLETAQIRYRDDGTAPTATVGQPVDPGSALVLCGNSVGAFKAIRTTGASGVLNISYYRLL